MTAPAVSVVLPVHDEADRVTDALARLTSLDPPPGGFEVIVVDDCSDDDTAPVAERAVSVTSPAWADDLCPVRVVRRERRGGPTAARRTGLAHARAEFVWMVDVDDEWEPSVIAALHRAASSSLADVVSCRARRLEPNGRTWVMEGVEQPTELDRREALVALLDGTITGHLWTKLFRRSVLTADTDRVPLRTHDDFVVVATALAHADRVCLLPDVLYTYRSRPGSWSSESSADAFEDLDRAASVTRDLADEYLPTDAVSIWRSFEAWFVLIPALTTPAHQRWGRAGRAVRRRYGPRLRWRAVAALGLRRGTRWGVHAAALKASGPLFGPTYRALGRVLGWSISPRR